MPAYQLRQGYSTSCLRAG